MAVIVGNKIYVDGNYVGSTDEFKDGTVINIEYDTQPVYVLS